MSKRVLSDRERMVGAAEDMLLKGEHEEAIRAHLAAMKREIDIRDERRSRASALVAKHLPYPRF